MKKKVQKTIEAVKTVIKSGRNAGMKIIYLRAAYRADYSNAGGPKSPNYWKLPALVKMRENPEWEEEYVIKGTWSWEIIDELKPQEEDVVVDKNRYNGFSNTELDVILRTFDVKYLIFVGIATNICVESTLRDAYFAEYFPILVKDACGNIGPDYTQDATIWNVKELFGWVITSENLSEALEGV